MAEKCRANARQCMKLAAQVEYPELRATFVEVANRWIKRAIELEKAGKRQRKDTPIAKPAVNSMITLACDCRALPAGVMVLMPADAGMLREDGQRRR
jgi:hypothetical protein